jgi:hypothetical protein
MSSQGMQTHILTVPVKVVGNEKWEGSRGWLLVEGDTGLWRSMFVYFLM